MNITGAPYTVTVNYILSGYYQSPVATGIKKRLYEFSSPAYPISNFQPPYDAYLANNTATGSGNSLIAVARRLKYPTDTVSSNRSGVLYYYDTPDLIGTCHGFGRDNNTFYYGFNFYNAQYPAGYFVPPYGENISVFEANQDGFDNLNQMGCAPLSVTEYNETFGIVSASASDVTLTTDTLTPNMYALIESPKETCPPEVVVTNYFDEINFNQIAGTVSAIPGGTLYNDNAIPTSLDNWNIKVNGRYAFTQDTNYTYITFTGGRPVASYSVNNQENRLNNTLCPATLMETDVSIGRGTNGLQLLETPDVFLGNFNSQVSFNGADPWHYWHFTYKDNADTLPFFNNFQPINAAPQIQHQTLNEGTQLFLPILSSEDAYWANRQCPDTVDYLPHNFGASIYACPSYHFDVPYYAAIKKFGFYGMRFLNNCRHLQLTATVSGAPNASELDPSQGTLPKSMIEPDGLDTNGVWTFSLYDNLIRIANAEERYSNMYAVNKGFFLWANAPFVSGTSDYAALTIYPGFESAFQNMVAAFQNVFQNGLSSFISGAPSIVIAGTNTINPTTAVLDSGVYTDLLFTTKVYDFFFKTIQPLISGSGDFQHWINIENQYAYYVSNGQGAINEGFYAGVVSGREQRTITRYMENMVRGNPIDLYPFNHITFAFDSAQTYLEHTGWQRGISSIGRTTLPDISRQYFEGAYGKGSLITGFLTIINQINFSTGTAFYPGFFNDLSYGQTIPTPVYKVVQSGFILDNIGRKFSASGWLAAGYHEIGGLRGNFSCFTPIFTQHPVNKVFCKVGQAPTFRAQAVDYHSIPDDKISLRYPEIMYWALRLKMVDANYKNLYPLTYKWYRISKDYYSAMLTSGSFAGADPSNPSGEWCAMEGDGPTCTVIHPKECYPAYTPSNTNPTNYTFIKGAKLGVDDQFYYFCMASGRFGVRISEKAELAIEDFLRFDVSFKNAMNGANSIGLQIVAYDTGNQPYTLNLTSSQAPAYAGYQYDQYAIPEAVVEQKIPPPNAGFGDVTAFRFIGPIGYVGTTRSYSPSTLYDTRGLREQWGRFLEYGNLLSFSTTLAQHDGDMIYGYKHLPTCVNYNMPNGGKGVQVIPSVGGNPITHWTLGQRAWASMTSNVGMKWQSLSHVGELYPPATSIADIDAPNLGIGHWQWGNNLGSIKRFGWLSRAKDDDIRFIGDGAPPYGQGDSVINQVKQQLIGPSDLAGANCGYTNYGLGRNMLYYIEAFDRFYLICDPIKKKNVQDISFMCPGLRQLNSAVQYFWMGHPSNVYVERRPMYGPYAYQWRVRRHNRDRNGNGISEGFYSMGWHKRFDNMYDAPAIYGLYVKKQPTSTWIGQVNTVIAARNQVWPNGNVDITQLRAIWFGQQGSEGTAGNYGNMTFSCDPNAGLYNQTLCNYVSAGSQLGTQLDFSAYQCPQDLLQAGQCFDPCISIRYGQGFFPGGKSQDMFGYDNSNSFNRQPKNVRLVAMANKIAGTTTTNLTDEQSKADQRTWFRPPINTPHARIWQGLLQVGNQYNTRHEDIAGVSPCKDGGSDHCNYMTPTIHLGTSSFMQGETTSMMAMIIDVANLYSAYNIRGNST